ncbi:MAG: ArnT family glycosyltransferase [Acidobacteriaceae bacterium]
MKEPIRKNQLRYLLAVALVLRIAFFLLVRPWAPAVLNHKILIGDAPGYHTLALRILAGQKLGILGSYRTPGYPLIQAGTYALFGDRPWVVLLLQIAANILTLVLLYRLAYIWFNENVAFFAALLYTIEPHTILYASELYSDTFFTTAVVAALLLFQRALKTQKLLDYSLTGLLVGAAALIRPVGEFLPIALIMLSFIYLWGRWARIFRASAIIILAFLATIAPWLYRNYHEYHAIALTSISGEMLLNWEVSYTEVAQTGKPIAEVREHFAKIAAREGADHTHNPFVKSRIQKAIALHYIKHHPIACAKAGIRGAIDALINLDTSGYAGLLGIKTASMHGWFSGASFRSRIIQFVSSKPVPDIVIGILIGSYLLGVYALVILGAYMLWRQRDYGPLLIAATMVTYFLMFIGPVGLARYKMPAVPFYIPLAGYALWRLSHVPDNSGAAKPVH